MVTFCPAWTVSSSGHIKFAPIVIMHSTPAVLHDTSSWLFTSANVIHAGSEA
jgi:hypothetical protein